jgi:adenine-specific DNA-methyltransferase
MTDNVNSSETLFTFQDELKINTSFSKENTASLYPGDCMDFLRQIPDNAIQLIITSPPYNIGKEYETKLDITEYVSQQSKVINECIRILKNEGSICWETGNYVDNSEIIPLDILLYNCFKSNGLKLRNRIIWHFGHGLHCSKRFSGRYETIMWFTKGDKYVFNLDEVILEEVRI